MHTLSKLAATLVAGALLTLPVIAAEKAAAAPAKAGTVATVNGTAISQSLFDAFYAEQKAQGMPDSAELRNAVKEELVRREILAQEAGVLLIEFDTPSATLAAERQIGVLAVGKTFRNS